VKYAIYNSIDLVCFTILAIVFNKWWIIFFALLFIMIPQVKLRHRRKCDGCGIQSDYGDSPDDAIKNAVRNGWVHIDDSDKDYCPECARKL
jgi:hypothetical protein